MVDGSLGVLDECRKPHLLIGAEVRDSFLSLRTSVLRARHDGARGFTGQRLLRQRVHIRAAWEMQTRTKESIYIYDEKRVSYKCSESPYVGS